MKKFLLFFSILILSANIYSQVWQQTTLDSQYVKCMLVNPVNNNLFVGTLYSDGVYLSTDYGNTWLIRNNGLSSTSIYGLAINSTGTLFAATWGGGMFRSTDNGLNWVQVNNGITNSVLFSVTVNPINNYVFAGSGGSGIYRSTDNGNSWTLVNNGLTSYNILSLAVAANGYIFAGTYDGVFRSTDNGDNWTATDITSGWGEGFATTNPTYNIFAGVHTVGVYRSSDFGNTFQIANNGLTQTSVFAIATTTFGYVYAGIFGGGGVYLSTNNGDSWSQLNNGLTNGDVRAFAITNNGYVFVGTFGNGVFRNDQPIPVELTQFLAYFNSGKVTLKWQTATEINNKGFEILRAVKDSEVESQWESIGFVDGKGNSSEINDYSFNDENISANGYWYKIKQVDYNGTYKFTNKIYVEIPKAEQFLVYQNYPNPFNSETKISWQLPVAGKTIIRIYNSIGEEIAKVYEEENVPGFYTYTLDFNQFVRDLSTGIYFLKIELNDLYSNEKIFSEFRKMVYLK